MTCEAAHRHPGAGVHYALKDTRFHQHRVVLWDHEANPPVTLFGRIHRIHVLSISCAEVYSAAERKLDWTRIGPGTSTPDGRLRVTSASAGKFSERLTGVTSGRAEVRRRQC